MVLSEWTYGPGGPFSSLVGGAQDFLIIIIESILVVGAFSRLGNKKDLSETEKSFLLVLYFKARTYFQREA